MELTSQQILEIARMVGLKIPPEDLENVALRLSTVLTEMEAIERELGALMDKADPIPPVYPHEAQD